jgi:hypothetical protein
MKPVLQEMEGGFCVMLDIEGDIEFGLSQCQAEQFALAWTVFDQQNGGVRHHI